MQSSSIRSEIQPAGGDDHDQVLSTPNEDQLENNSWQREMESLDKLITAEESFIETLPETTNKHHTDMAELKAAFQKLKADGKGEVSELRKMKKLVMYWKERASKSSREIPSPRTRYHELGTELKLCLLCLAAFPENAKIRRRVLVQWWIGEGFVPPLTREDDETAEDWGDLYFHELINRGFLEPDDKGNCLSVKTCRMHPLVHSVIVKLAADEKFFDIDLKEWSEKRNHWRSLRSCLKVGKGLTDLQDLKKLNTLFNVDETLLTLNPDWFSKMKNARVLHLGSWQATETHEINVLTKRSTNKKYVNALDGLENATKLRLLNLERFSRISKLSSSIAKLTHLTILNLRACHNLEFLPDGIGCLVNLTHLNMSDCYLLEHMPKGISQLTKIQVLQGFVVKNTDGIAACTLWDLRGCKELRKLGLHIKQIGFPSENELSSLNSLSSLIKLKIAWGSTHGIIEPIPPPFYGRLMKEGLMKLELECLPFTSLPIWLQPSNLPSLKKLCVTGGKLSCLPEFLEHGVWKIEELHLKYMNDLVIEWDNLRKQIPKLKYLKKVDCPNLSLFPCDENGVWTL